MTDTYFEEFYTALNVTESDAHPCTNVLVGRRCKWASGAAGRCACEALLHGTGLFDHAVMLVRAPRLKVLLLEPYCGAATDEDMADTYARVQDLRERIEPLDLYVSVGEPGTGRWHRAGEPLALKTLPIAISAHEWLADEVARFDLVAA